MRLGAAALAVVFALMFAGCQGGDAASSDGSATATATPDSTETPATPPVDILPTTPTPLPATPTAEPLPPATPSGLWVYDLGRGKRTLLYEGDGAVSSQIEPSGSDITVLVVDEDGTHATRFHTDGESIESYTDRGMVVSSPNGEYRFYLDLNDPDSPELTLEHQGERVRLEGTRPRVGVAFAPGGDRLLAVSERPGSVAGEVVRTYSVHTSADGRLRMQFEHRALAGSQPSALWSPSGRYVADEGIGGIFVRDTVTGRAWRLGPSGSPRWSPIADQLLVVSDLGRLSVVNVPELDGIDLGPIEQPAALGFDQSGRLAIVTTYEDPEQRAQPTTRAFDVASGAEVAVWSAMDTAETAIGGLDPVIALDGGVAGVFGSTSCLEGFVVQHPGLGDTGRCFAGANPRWSPNGEFLLYARERELVVFSVSSDSERVIVRGTPPADEAGGPHLRWGPDGSWVLIEWTVQIEADATP